MADDVQKPTEGRVRRIEGRIYITLGGVEHGMDEAVAAALAVRLNAELQAARADRIVAFKPVIGMRVRYVRDKEHGPRSGDAGTIIDAADDGGVFWVRPDTYSTGRIWTTAADVEVVA